MSPVVPAPSESDIPEENLHDSTNASEPHAYFANDSDSESEGEEHAGYEPLPQDPEHLSANDSDEEDNEIVQESTQFASPYSNLLPPPPIDEPLEINRPEADIKMDEDRIETIKCVMKGITLPPGNLPQWANLVPEEEWKAALLTQMSTKNDKKTPC